jgi:DNA-binding transcriptional ArsR family regulator
MSTGLCCSDVLIESYADRLKVCGHPLRLKILCLIEREDSCVTDLWQCLNQSQPVISQHLAVLKEKGIVHAETRGNKRIYSIIDPFIKHIVRSFYQNDDGTLSGEVRSLGRE